MASIIRWYLFSNGRRNDGHVELSVARAVVAEPARDLGAERLFGHATRIGTGREADCARVIEQQLRGQLRQHHHAHSQCDAVPNDDALAA
jgi:hypothetical protein